MNQANFEHLVEQLDPHELSPKQVQTLMRVTTMAMAHLAKNERLMELAIDNRYQRPESSLNGLTDVTYDG